MGQPTGARTPLAAGVWNELLRWPPIGSRRLDRSRDGGRLGAAFEKALEMASRLAASSPTAATAALDWQHPARRPLDWPRQSRRQRRLDGLSRLAAPGPLDWSARPSRRPPMASVPAPHWQAVLQPTTATVVVYSEFGQAHVALDIIIVPDARFPRRRRRRWLAIVRSRLGGSILGGGVRGMYSERRAAGGMSQHKWLLLSVVGCGRR